MRIEENVSLKSLSTMKTGGEARYFCRASSIDELDEAFQFVRDKKLRYFILGGGSNLVFSDEGFDGVVIQPNIEGMEFKNEEEDVFVTAGSGIVWDDLVRKTVEKGLYGLENLSLIPGNVGASAVQNIGAYGAEVESVIQEVVAYNVETRSMKIFFHDECLFAYRHSFFKTPEGKKYVITQVVYKLSKKEKVKSVYESLQKKLEEKNIFSPTLHDIRETVIAIRKEKLPYENGLGSAGSFFKNPTVAQEHCQELLKKFPAMPSFVIDDTRVKIPAGWLIDNVCGMRGTREGDVGCYEKQALVIVNYGNATAREIKQFAEKIIACVKEKTGIVLEREVEYVE